MATIIGFKSGETNTNVIIGPIATPALSNPNVNGMVEQAQNGVILPSSAASKYPVGPFLDR